MGIFFPENCDKTDEVNDEIPDSLEFSIFSLYLSMGKVQHLTF